MKEIFMLKNCNEINGGFEIVLYNKIYDKEAILATAYKYEQTFIFEIESFENNKFKMIILEKHDNKINIFDIENLIAELNDQQLRLEILKRTDKIREKIFDKAFSPIMEVKE
jgi:His-Xaa-Ser system protein HxsD